MVVAERFVLQAGHAKQADGEDGQGNQHLEQGKTGPGLRVPGCGLSRGGLAQRTPGRGQVHLIAPLLLCLLPTNSLDQYRQIATMEERAGKLDSMSSTPTEG